MARPNVLMFSDGQWLWNRSSEQEQRFETWLATLTDARFAVIEIGAGTAIPSVRRMSEALRHAGADLIRINPRESEGPPRTVSLAMGALEALRAIDSFLNEKSPHE